MPDLSLGALVDAATHQRQDAPVCIPTADLTTHGVIVGMTGSGKTGLGVVLIEEILSAGVPCLLIDPKGDLGNLCLMFPELAPADFRPWVDEGQAKQAAVTPDEYAAQQAAAWRDGLAGWGLGPERIQALTETVRFTIYTPGSTAGVPVNIVGSLRAPADIADLETVRDEVGGYVSGLLALVGIDADPLASKEHILLSNLIETSWAAGRDLDLPTLVAQVAQPPIRKLGVFDLDSFYPPAERTTLAMRLNGLIASPAFAAWAQGDPLDIAAMLWDPSGRPNCAIVNIAHLSDEERQFVVSLLLSKLVTWMRKQSGTSDLRTLLYMDEVAGYVPPSANPPTKKPIMLLMKQARAFGVGVVLSTQNPVDVDYKALSNAGTWMIGRLQTERDKARLLDGMTAAAGTVDVQAVGDTISALGKREFVLKRAGKDHPEVFTTRWAMSYLRGPLTRDQIAALTVAATPAAAAPDSALPPPPMPAEAAPAVPPPAAAQLALGADETPVLPETADGVPVRWLDPAAGWAAQVGASPTATRYRAAAVARTHLRYDDTRAAIHHDEEFEAVLFPLGEIVDATTALAVDYDDRDLRTEQPPGAVYVLSAAKLKNKTYWSTLQRGLVDHIARTESLEIFVNRDLKLYGRPDETREQFLVRCHEAADRAADAAAAKLRDKYELRMDKIRLALDEATARAEDLAEDAAAKRRAEQANGVTGLITGLFSGRRNTRSLTRDAERAMGRSSTGTSQLAAAERKADSLSGQLSELEQEIVEDIVKIDAEWEGKAERVETLPLRLAKSDVSVSNLSLVWIPTD